MLAALHVNFTQARLRGGVDLLPWDFLREFEVQKRQWLDARTKLEAAKALEKVYEELPAEVAASIEMPMTLVETDEGPPVRTVDYDALMRSSRIVDLLLRRLMGLGTLAEDDDMALLLLIAVVH